MVVIVGVHVKIERKGCLLSYLAFIKQCFKWSMCSLRIVCIAFNNLQ